MTVVSTVLCFGLLLDYYAAMSEPCQCPGSQGKKSQCFMVNFPKIHIHSVSCAMVASVSGIFLAMYVRCRVIINIRTVKCTELQQEEEGEATV